MALFEYYGMLPRYLNGLFSCFCPTATFPAIPRPLIPPKLTTTGLVASAMLRLPDLDNVNINSSHPSCSNNIPKCTFVYLC